jgi:hypothetical protein
VPRQRNWDTLVERWLVDHLAPDVTPLEVDALAGHLPSVVAAWQASVRGTRAELRAARESARACGQPADPNDDIEAPPAKLCLEPLVRGTVDLASTSTRK